MTADGLLAGKLPEGSPEAPAMDSAALPRPLRAAPTTWRCSELRDLPGHANLLWHARSAASAHAREPPCKLGRPVIRPSIPAVAGLPRQAARRPGELN